MNLQSVIDGYYSFIDSVATAADSAIGRLRRPLKIRLIEDDKDNFRLELPPGKDRLSSGEARLRIVDGAVADATPVIAAALKGSQAEVVLLPDRFLFRPLDVPQRAAEFLESEAAHTRRALNGAIPDLQPLERPN